MATIVDIAHELLADGFEREYARGVLELVVYASGGSINEDGETYAALLGIPDWRNLYNN